MFPRVKRPGSGNRVRPPGRHRTGQVGAALIVLAAVAGCSSSSSSPATPRARRARPARPPPAAAPPRPRRRRRRCPRLRPGPRPARPAACADAGALVRVTRAACTRRSSSPTPRAPRAPCTATRASSLVSAPPYTQIGLAAKRGSTTPVKLITLAPGATANALLQIVDALNFPTATCSPAKAAFLRVYPPNQTAPVYLADASEVCAQPVQTLFISAVQAGSSSGGTVVTPRRTGCTWRASRPRWRRRSPSRPAARRRLRRRCRACAGT